MKDYNSPEGEFDDCSLEIEESVSELKNISIEALGLQGYVQTAADQLVAAHPEVQFTSGRRSVQSQANAMASNIIASNNRNWIASTYASSAERTQLQNWVDSNPQATTVSAIETGLSGIMSRWSDAQKVRISRHLSGEAFDVRPTNTNRAAIIATIKGLPRLRKFLEHEGGLERWHAEFE